MAYEQIADYNDIYEKYSTDWDFFEQSYVGGTAFFENQWDKVPDVTYGSWPNRLVLYNGQRNHAACHDYTFEKRYSIILFFNLIESSEHIKI